MNNRIRELRKTLNLSQHDFAARIGLKQNAISCMENATVAITKQTVKLICLEFLVNEDWLMYGKGAMFEENQENIGKFLSLYKELSPEFQDYILRITKELLHTQQLMEKNTKE